MKIWIERARAVWTEAQRVLNGIEEHAVFSHAAAMGFFMFFSIPPAVLALVSLVSLIPVGPILNFLVFEGREWVLTHVQAGLEPEAGAVAARIVDSAVGPWFNSFVEVQGSALADQLQSLLDLNLPAAAAVALGQFVRDVLEAPRPDLLTIGFVALLWTASGATRTAMRALNAIYEVRRHAFWQRVLVSFALTLAILVGASTTLTALPVGNAVAEGVVDFFDLPSRVLYLWSALNWLVGLGFMLIVVTAILRYGPHARQTLRQVAPGAALTVLLWVMLGIGLRYWATISWERTNATYGALAAIIVLLLWCYLVSTALLLGAEVNAWLVERRGLAQRVVGGLALPHARRWSPLVPYQPGPPLRLMRRFIRRLRRGRGEAVQPEGKEPVSRPPRA